MRLIDLSHGIEDAMPVYWGDPETRVVQYRCLADDQYNAHLLKMALHAGTHIDVPMHLSPDARFVADIPIDRFFVRGCVLDVRGKAEIDYAPELESVVAEDCALLLHTAHDRHYGTEHYFGAYPVVTMSFARFLVRKRVKIFGLDTPSPDNPPFPVHKELFRNGIFVLENLTNLAPLLEAEEFDLIALPLRVQADSSPVRAVACIRE